METPAGPPVCPDCGEPVVATMCRLGPDPSPAAVAALADVIVAAHRKLAHGKRAQARAR